MKLLVLTTRLFGVPRSGGELCTARLLRGLREAGHRVTLAGRGDAAAAQCWAERVVGLGAVVGALDERPLAMQAAVAARALLLGEAVTVSRHGGLALRSTVRQLLGEPFDAVIVDHLQAWPWLGSAPRPPAVLVAHNVESDIYRSQRLQSRRDGSHTGLAAQARGWVMKRESGLLLALERRALREAREVLCLSAEDAARLASLADGLANAPQVLPGYPLQPVQRQPAHGQPDPRRVGMIGTWTWAPNRRALQWMLAEVWPLMATRCELVLAGQGLQTLAVPQGVRVLGPVAEVADFYAQVDLLAVPSLYGSGVQEKAVEAIGSGAPVVATTSALRGMGRPLPGGVVLADTASAFAQACIEVALPASPAERNELRVERATWAAQRRSQYQSVLTAALNGLSSAPTAADDRGTRLAGPQR